MNLVRKIDLRSDTVTQPSPQMREAMATAEVGDDVFGDDPTVNRFQQKIAKVLGKEEALFVPSGTMANLVAILSHTTPGETVLLHPDAHPFRFEAANLAMVGGLLTHTVPGDYGIMDPEALAPRIVRSDDVHRSETSLISIENTTNMGGGNIYPLETISAMRALADENDLKIYCDGARLFNASVASQTPASDLVRDCDTVSVCFSKGLGCPAGSIVAGETTIITKARKFRKLLGGGMRQVGILAAAAEYALENNVERLADDHRRVQQFREALEDAGGISFPLPCPTNIVFFDVDDAPKLVEAIGHQGVMMLALGPNRIRAVFHLDIDDEGLERAIDACKKAANDRTNA